MNSKAILFNNEGILRSGWRFSIFVAAFFVLGSILAVIGYASLLGFGFTPKNDSGHFLAVNGVLSLAGALFVGWLCGKYLEHLPFKALGASFSQRWLRNLVLGMLIGSAELAFAVLIAWAFGGLTFEFNRDADRLMIAAQLASVFLIFAAAAAFEEALFRGYILQTFARSGLAWLAIALTSIFFGVAHYSNPNATLISTINTVLAGIMFALAYLKTRDLWFPFGMHLMWNWMQGAVFGIEVSGLNDIAGSTLLKEIDRGPVWLTGENYGIEGGIACTIALVAAVVVISLMPQSEPPA
ncbi:MAG TPA: type II CAAX endopeptidase family protein [Pyrinomonadaceae bacterium]|jgi:hypothetical protein|nr:type II CAAX endopeptidase family protein [Pyrinomonadaceae bacterium]